MKLTIYKGFDKKFLYSLTSDPLLENSIESKKNVLSYSKKIRKTLSAALLQLEDDEEAWITYEEYSLIKNIVEDAITQDGLKIDILKNNLYPEYYPLEFTISSELAEEIVGVINGDIDENISTECENYLLVYNTLLQIDGAFYGSFYNYEYDNEKNVTIKDYYPYNISVEDSAEESDYDLFLNEDAETYLRDLNRIREMKPRVIGLKTTDNEASKRLQKSLQAFCVKQQIKLIYYHERLSTSRTLEKELIDIAKNDIHINGFEEFRKIKFYKNPDIDKEVIELSQAHIIEEIIRQAENSYDYESGSNFRDLFITASTGAGKSVMFQIPAIYLAKKYKKLTIIIEPVKALMQDQKEKLTKNGYLRAETFNSDLISQVEKEAVLQKVKNGDVDLLYLSPETLLSYSIETIIGDREIGLLIIDEAHIVTTWGVGFRPDYWYLGSYINRLRNQIQTASRLTRP